MRLSCRIHPPGPEGGVHSRPVQSQIHVSPIIFPKPAKFSPLVRRRVGVGGATLMMRMLSHMSAAVKTCWYHTICRHHHNKATITNSFTFWGFSGYQPWRDSLGKNKRKAQCTNLELCWCFFVSVVFLLCRSRDATTKQWHVCTIHINIVSVRLMLLQDQGCNVLFGTVLFVCLFVF